MKTLKFSGIVIGSMALAGLLAGLQGAFLRPYIGEGGTFLVAAILGLATGAIVVRLVKFL